MATNIEKDEVTGTNTTGHEWDGIKELNTPLPKWWLYTFYGTVIWGLAYTVAYPAWPMLTSATPGLLGYTSRGELAESVNVAREGQKAQLDKISAASVEDILKDPAMLAFAQAGGAAAFKVNCVQCHGAGAAGSAGYPNLNDNDWLWGGTADTIHTTLKHGIRHTLSADTRDSQMPSFGADGILKPDEIVNVSNFVISLGGGQADSAQAEAGKQLYADNCAACHGDAGTGNAELGAPNLVDKIWLYGGTVREVAQQVTKPRHGVMPGWATRLDDTTIKQLTVYVHSLGGGEAAVPATQ